VERGYLYIAQPPLFKVKRGKSERYIKNEAALEEYLLDHALANVVVRGGAEGSINGGGSEGQVIPEAALRSLLEAASRMKRIFERLAQRQIDERLVEAAIWSGLPRLEDLADEGRLAAARSGIEQELSRSHPDDAEVHWSQQPDDEHGAHRLVAQTRRSGATFRTVLDTAFLRSSDFQVLVGLAAEILAQASAPFTLSSGDGDPEPLPTPNDLLVRTLAIGQKGLSIQRYKGLGEMNPDQLADTTMDVEARTLLQVRVEDAVEADEVFTTLMGDEVEPRRQFIEDNALSVENLDV
jgi:DNA gyrase subunit B